jgi:hypothetical protein
VNTQAVARYVLARAAAKVGGVAKLASRLSLSQRVLSWYIHGETQQIGQQAAQSFPESERDR